LSNPLVICHRAGNAEAYYQQPGGALGNSAQERPDNLGQIRLAGVMHTRATCCILREPSGNAAERKGYPQREAQAVSDSDINDVEAASIGRNADPEDPHHEPRREVSGTTRVLPETSRGAAAGLFFRFIVLAIGLNALLGLGLIVFDIADTLRNTRDQLTELGDVMAGLCSGLLERHPDQTPREVVSEASALTGTAMALLNRNGELVFSTHGDIAEHLPQVLGLRPTIGVHFEINAELGPLSGAWALYEFVDDLRLLAIVPHSPEDEGLLQYMTISAGVLGLGLAISFWIMLAATRWGLHRPLQRLVDNLTGALAKDVQRRREAERQAVAARLEAERHLAFRNNLIDASSSVGIVATDAAGRIQIYNRAAEQILGYQAHEVVGNMTLEALAAMTSRAANQELPLRSMMQPLAGEEFVVDKQGDQHLVALSRSDIVDSDGRLMGELLAFVDVTKPRRLEAELHVNELQLVQSAKLASLGEMATGVAHELNQPLNNIGLLSSRVLKRLDSLPHDDARFCRERLEGIRGQVDRASKIIDQLRSFGRRSERQLENIDIREPIDHVHRMLCQQFEEQGIELRIELPAELPQVRADPAQLEQVIVNLLTNARDALASSSSPSRSGEPTVTIRAQPAELDDNPALAIVIADNGPGMSDEVKSRVFQPFFTTKDPGKGTGLGLSISYGLVRGFGGTLDVESLPGQGAEFSILLPLAPDHDDRTPQNPAR
jgi:PAS domain S-box-containing protein